MTFTTLPVHPETLARLKGYKMGGASYDKVLNELMDDHPPEKFLKEHLRRLRDEKSTPWRSIKADLKL